MYSINETKDSGRVFFRSDWREKLWSFVFRLTDRINYRVQSAKIEMKLSTRFTVSMCFVCNVESLS